MTEQEFIDAQDLANLRIAQIILSQCSIFQGDTIKEANRLVLNRIIYLNSKQLIDSEEIP